MVEGELWYAVAFLDSTACGSFKRYLNQDVSLSSPQVTWKSRLRVKPHRNDSSMHFSLFLGSSMDTPVGPLPLVHALNFHGIEK